MKFDTLNIEYSSNDKKLGITLPQHLDTDLAYLVGIQIGDGYLKKSKKKRSVNYIIAYDGHHLNDSPLYCAVLKKLILKLFNKSISVSRTKSGTVKIAYQSKAIFTFLTEVCEIHQSPKTNIRIPKKIMIANLEIKRAFLQGLADTDFSLTFKERKRVPSYPVIYFQTNSKTLYEDTAKLLTGLQFRVVHNSRKNYRSGKIHDGYYIQISGRVQLDKWMDEIGFRSLNHITRFLVWKHTDRLAPGTDINDRITILRRIGVQMDPLRPRSDSN